MALRVLILGGTAEASALAGGAVAAGHDVLTSLAGRTSRPALPAGRVRIGGFGGPEGLAAFLDAERIDALVDATHPFAATISANAERACRLRPTPRLMLLRPAWTRQDGDRWLDAGDMAEAARLLPAGARVFLAVGRQELDAFAGRPDTWFLLRVVDPPEAPPPLARHELVLGRGPFRLEDELALLARHRIGWIVAKNAGGEGSGAKLAAARRLGLPVVMVRRPGPPPGPRVPSAEGALDWLAALPPPHA
ncbi:cobalt-precorrin-6A reductase [Arenibaculum sp.]|uniref:cobalt-precorrin-6A reductase n=1 Tax=Arenibaculum sp. TaxID=2865862 RepID=UPI002E119A9F|nr:cobalt-precorrin-6A reductase [Arenibaculum sp.]